MEGRHHGPPGPAGAAAARHGTACPAIRAPLAAAADAGERARACAGPGRSMVSGRLAAAWRPAGLAAAAAFAACTLLAVAMSSLHGAQSPAVLLETQDMGVGYMRQPAQDFAAPPSQQGAYGFPQYFQGGQQLAGGEEMQPVPCSQSLAGCPPSPAEAPLSDPAGAPTYNSGEGMTYMPSTQSGVSDQDQSPDLPQSFLDGEARSKRRMKKLAKLLKKSSKEQDALDVRVKELSEYVKGEVTSIRNDVMEINAKDTDEIAAPYHLVQGARWDLPGRRHVLALRCACGCLLRGADA